MPRLAPWTDLFAALQRLRAFLADRASRAWGRGPATEPDPRLLKAKPELNPMDWRNPPSENITSVALPLAASAAAALAAIAFADLAEAADA
ncbi:MAG: hypothetical protein K2V38_01650, partial [Gemmataceae bacterium]|nr:hypothetical protein [Gemmataceae bacterium]